MTTSRFNPFDSKNVLVSYSTDYIQIAGKTLSVKGIAFVQPGIDPGDSATRVTYWGGASVELDAATDYVVAKLGLR